MSVRAKKVTVTAVPIAANAAGPTSSRISPMTTPRPPSTSLAAVTSPEQEEASAAEEAEAPDEISATSAASTMCVWQKMRAVAAGSEGFSSRIQRDFEKRVKNISWTVGFCKDFIDTYLEVLGFC